MESNIAAEPEPLTELAKLIDWAAYGPKTPPLPLPEIDTICAAAIHVWSYRQFVALKTRSLHDGG